MTQVPWYVWRGEDLIVRLKLHTRARHDRFLALTDDRLKVQITAPPVDGQANRHLIVWLAKAFGVNRSAVVLESGMTSPLKRVRIIAPKKLPQGLPPVPGGPA